MRWSSVILREMRGKHEGPPPQPAATPSLSRHMPLVVSTVCWHKPALCTCAHTKARGGWDVLLNTLDFDDGMALFLLQTCGFHVCVLHTGGSVTLGKRVAAVLKTYWSKCSLQKNSKKYYIRSIQQ